jgi:hypothetical protein
MEHLRARHERSVACAATGVLSTATTLRFSGIAVLSQSDFGLSKCDARLEQPRCRKWGKKVATPLDLDTWFAGQSKSFRRMFYGRLG